MPDSDDLLRDIRGQMRARGLTGTVFGHLAVLMGYHEDEHLVQGGTVAVPTGDASGVNLDSSVGDSSGSTGQWHWKPEDDKSRPDTSPNLDDLINEVEIQIDAQFDRDFPDDTEATPPNPETPTAGSSGLPRWAVPAAAIALGVAAVMGFFFTRSSGGKDSSASASPGTGANVAAAQYQCATGDAIPLFNNFNAQGVTNGGTPPSFSTNGKTYCLDQIQTYHWNGGYGDPPGQLWLDGVGGKVGPFQAQGSAGQNGVLANWYVSPPREILNGTYTCGDSDPARWSSNNDSGGQGFCQVWVRDATPGGPTGSPVAGK